MAHIAIATTPVLAVVDGHATTTSTEVARVFGKQHRNVLQAIDGLLLQLSEDRLLNFQQTVEARENPSGGAPIQSRAFTCPPLRGLFYGRTPMAAVTLHPMPTLAAVDAAIEVGQERGARPYLGMSAIGNPCERALWYSFHWAKERQLPAKALKAIEDGHRGEDVMAERLRLVKGVQLHTVSPQTGKQFEVIGCGGHFKGHMDGAILGVLEAPKTWHVWEHKQVNEAKFKKLLKLVQEVGEKNALAQWDEVYHAQALCYMGFTGMTRHFLTVCTPGGREYCSVRTDASPGQFEALVSKAQRIIDAPEPLHGISADPSFYLCKWCDFHALCHSTEVAQPNCRTCLHSTPVHDGQWNCARHQGMVLTVTKQRQGCDAHRFNPALLGHFAQVVDASDQDNWVKYRLKNGGKEFTNGARPAAYSSEEIAAVADKQALGLVIDQFMALREQFGAEVVG